MRLTILAHRLGLDDPEVAMCVFLQIAKAYWFAVSFFF